MTDEIQTFEETFEPEKEYVVSSLETLKVVSDPIRLRILETLVVKAMTVKEVAARLGLTATKLYYHINLMEEHGLIRVVSQRIVSGIIEKQYRTRAYSFDVDKSLLAINPAEEGGPVDMMLHVVFDSTRDDVRNAIDKGLMTPGAGDPIKRNGIIFRSITKLTPEGVGEFQERLLALAKEFNLHINEGTPDEEDETLRTYGFTVALFPMVEDIPNNRTTINID